MSTINDFLTRHLSEIEAIIKEFELEREFSSHDFIEKFSARFESSYIDMLSNYQGSGKAFQTVHGIIARFLSTNKLSLDIEKIAVAASENVHGTESHVQWWVRKS